MNKNKSEKKQKEAAESEQPIQMQTIVKNQNQGHNTKKTAQGPNTKR